MSDGVLMDKKEEKQLVSLPLFHRHRQTDRQTERQTDRQTYRQTHTHTHTLKNSSKHWTRQQHSATKNR